MRLVCCRWLLFLRLIALAYCGVHALSNLGRLKHGNRRDRGRKGHHETVVPESKDQTRYRSAAYRDECSAPRLR